MKAIWKIAFVFLLTVGGIFAVSLNTLAAAKPYEYTFEKVTDFDVNDDFNIDLDTNLFNRIKAINKLKITFDKEISPSEESLFIKSASNNPVKVVEKDGENPVNIISDVKIYPDEKGKRKVLTVFFKNLDYIDYTNPNKLEYELVINKNTLQFDQLEEYRIPFYIYDILPGFKSTFVDTAASTINTNIFKVNAPRDISIHVPKIYIRGIETIHHYDGILPDPIPKEDGDITQDPVNDNTRRNPALTNIDVIADEDADRLKVTFKNIDEYSRDLYRRTDVDGFTMGHAGIRDITKYRNESLQEFQLRAFDENGRFLEQRDFKLRVTDPINDYIVTDYLPEPTDEFGQTYSLYDLMADRTLLENIVTRIPVSQLDSLRITYAVGKHEVEVETEEQLLEALKNETITNIKLKDNIRLSDPLIIDRSITMEGKQLIGPIQLGTGYDINVKLIDIQIMNNLTIDVGANGTVILEDVTVDDGSNNPPMTKIISGGSNSIHAKDFKSAGGIFINNETPVRLVNDGVRNDITINGNAPVTLEGEYGLVSVENTPTLYLIDFETPYSIDLDNTDSVELATSSKISSIIFNGAGPVTLIGSYGTITVETEDSRLITTRDTVIDSIIVQDDKDVDITGEGTIHAVHGDVTLPSALIIDVSAEAVADANKDKVLIKFNKKVFRSVTNAVRTPLNPGTNATNGDFDDYFYVMRGNSVLIPISSNPYRIVDDNQNNIADDNQTFSILLGDNIKIGDRLKIGLKPGKTLYDENGKPITGATKTVTVTSSDQTFSWPNASVANNSNKITLDFAEDIDTATVGTGDFSVSVNGTSRSVNNVNAYGDKIDIYLYNTTLSTGNSVTINLNAHAQGKITDKVGNKLNSYNETVIVP